MSALADLLVRRPHVLLDFDGPVCAVFGGTGDRAVADRLRADLPSAVAAGSDPFDVLRHAATLGPGVLARVADELTRLEIDAVATATPTPGAVEAIRALRNAGHTVTIVSNNAAPAVAAYLDRHDLRGLVTGVSARTDPSPSLLTPGPHLLLHAVTALGTTPARCVLIGDSTTDVTAAQAAGTAVVGLADRPGKREQFRLLGANAVVDAMSTVAEIANGLLPDPSL